MTTNRTILSFVVVLPLLLGGCAAKHDYAPTDPQPDGESLQPIDYGTATYDFPRLVVCGTVTNTGGGALGGIYVAVFGVREPAEPDILTYNYAVTDSAGHYTIIRYRGRQLPDEVTVVATDSAGIYREQYLFAPVTYDYKNTPQGQQPYNAFVTADFVLKSTK